MCIIICYWIFYCLIGPQSDPISPVRVALLVHDNSFCLASWKNFPGIRSSQSAACIQDSWRPAYLLGSYTNLTLYKPFQHLAAWNLAAPHDQKLKVSDRLIDYIDYSLTTHLSEYSYRQGVSSLDLFETALQRALLILLTHQPKLASCSCRSPSLPHCT